MDLLTKRVEYSMDVKADLFNVEQIQHLLDYKPPWREMLLQQRKNLSTKYEGDSSNETLRGQFTGAEKDQLRRLPNKDYLLDKEEEIPLYLGLLDIIYAYAYNHRTTEGENTVESCWTIARISSTFSWFESFTSVKDVLISCARRTLAYPLYRHWSLVAAVLQDTREIFALGRRQILKCLLEIHALCLEEDPWFLLNDLYVTDHYCVWIQKASQKKLTSLKQSIEQIEIRKSDLSWELEELECAAALVQGEEEGAAAGQAAEARDEQNEGVFHCDSDGKDHDDDDDDEYDNDDDDDDDDEDVDDDDDKSDDDDDNNDDVDNDNDVSDDANGGDKCVDNNKRKDDIGQSATEESRSGVKKEGNGLIFSNADKLKTADSL